jgi:hypothetical protein
MSKLKKLASLVMLASSITVASSAMAGAKIEGSDGKWISVGIGARTSFTATEDASPSGDDWSSDFNLDSARIYVNGMITKNIGFEFNTEAFWSSSNAPFDEEFGVLDAIGKFSITPAFNVWVGRMLVPADREEMSGPYYANIWNWAKTPFGPADWGADHGKGNAGLYGRDEGVTVWGGLGEEKRFTYAVGIFEGYESIDSTDADPDDNFLYSGRFSYNFLNVESNPGYYTSSTYYGGLGDILTVSFAAQMEEDATGTAADLGDFTALYADVLYETVLENKGVVTIEAAYKDFDLDGKTAVYGNPKGGPSLFEGESWKATGLYLFPNTMGIGKIQPYFAYSVVSPEGGNDTDTMDIGFNYIIDGVNSRVMVAYTNTDTDGGTDNDAFVIGYQFQY